MTAGRPWTLHRRRDGAWLAGLAAVGLLGLTVFTCVVRADAVGEGYALARAQAECRSLERRIRTVNADVLARFAAFDQVVDARAESADPTLTDTEEVLR